MIKLIVSQDLLHSLPTRQIAFDQQDFHLTSEFQCVMSHCCEGLVFKLETLIITFT